MTSPKLRLSSQRCFSREMFPKVLPLGFELIKTCPGFNNFQKCFKNTKYNGEYDPQSQARVAQWIRGWVPIPRVAYRSGFDTKGSLRKLPAIRISELFLDALIFYKLLHIYL